MEHLRERELAEFDRWLYVAVTRAKETLTLSWSEIGKQSWASRSPWFLRRPGEHAGEGYSYSLVDSMPEPSAYKNAADAAPTVRELQQPSARELPSRRSVTELVDREVEVKTSGDDMIKRWQAQTLGTRIHRALEALKYGSAMNGEDEAVRFVAELKDPPLAKWIATGETEWGFHVKAEERVIEGKIDLWDKADGKLYIVDYKSGSPAFEEQAFRQLSLYAWALRKFGHTEPAELLVIYPRLKKTSRRPFGEELFHHWENVLGASKA